MAQDTWSDCNLGTGTDPAIVRFGAAAGIGQTLTAPFLISAEAVEHTVATHRLIDSGAHGRGSISRGTIHNESFTNSLRRHGERISPDDSKDPI